MRAQAMGNEVGMPREVKATAALYHIGCRWLGGFGGSEPELKHQEGERSSRYARADAAYLSRYIKQATLSRYINKAALLRL